MVNNKFLKNLNVLYVEDDFETAKKFSSILAKLFNQVFYAPNGKEALELFNKNSINLVVSDINMPIMDGLELSKEIKALSKNTPIVLITARNETEPLLKAIELNIDSYILKPISLNDFIDKIFSISERIEAKEQQKLLDQYKIVVDDSSIVMKFDLDGKITYINNKYLSITGFKEDEIIGKYFSFNQHKNDSSSKYLEIWEVITKNKTWHGKLKNYNINKNSYTVDTRIVPLTDVNNNIKEYISISYDISNDEKLNEFLHIEIENYKDNLVNKTQILNEYQKSLNLATAMVKVDKNLEIINANSKFLKILGYKRNELIGKNIFDFFDESKTNFFNLLEKIEKKEFAQQLITLLDKNSDTKYVDLAFSPILSANNELVEFLVLGTDVTETIELHKEIETTQKDVIFTLGSIGEKRSQETANHVKRVAEYSYLIAKKLGLDEKTATLIQMASPMHDIGKIAIPDEILNKKGKLTAEEFEIMKKHTTIGYEMLNNSNREILKASAIISFQHHEKWDGSGYPKGLKGEEIHIYGRITAVADVFDALASSRCYKNAWAIEDVLTYMKEQKAIHFDPKIVEILLDNLEDFLVIKEQFKDLVEEQGEVA